MGFTNRKVINWLSLSGVFALVFYFLHVFIGMQNYPGYNWLHQAVSDLTAVNSPSYQIASRYTSLYGSLSWLCCVIVTLIIQNKVNKIFRLGIYLYTVMNWISNIGYGLFPLSKSGFQGTFQDIMHFYVVTILVVVLSIASLLLIIIGGLKTNNTKIISIFALLALVSMFFGSIALGAFSKMYFGLWERFSVFSVVIFTCFLGLFGFLINTEKETQ
jgi:hypothetical protein